MSTNSQSGIFQVGDVLNNTYRIEKVLGRGGTSEVYRARSEISGRVMALKALRSELSRNEDFLALMTREEDMREIRHDAVVRYYDNQRTDDGHIYLVMDYVDGPGLDQKMKDGPMSAEDLMVIGKRIAEGLVVAHGRKIVHRDLSPDNIILRNGNPAEAVIIDFGIAKDSNPGAETIVGNEFAGKYAYAAPEQLSGQTDERADVYALGALLLAAFRGKAPFAGNNPMEVVKNKAMELDTTGVPEPLKTLINRMTVPDRDNRIPTAQAVLDQIINPQVAPTAAEPQMPDVDDDQTVIVPVSTKRPPPAELEDVLLEKAPSEAPKKVPEKAPEKRPEEIGQKDTKSGRSKSAALPIVAGVGAVVLAGGLFFVGAFDGLFEPELPVADPYTLIAERREDGLVQAVGHVPSEDVMTRMTTTMDGKGGESKLILAKGTIPPGWGDGVLTVIDAVDELPEWKVSVEGGRIAVTGQSTDRDQAAAVRTAMANQSLPQGMIATTRIEAGPRMISAAMLEPILLQFGDCGELVLVDTPPIGYSRDSQVEVSGRVSDIRTRAALSDALGDQIGDRDLVLDVDVLNPTLCLVDSALPDAPSGGFDIVLGFGSKDEVNTSGRYFVGENPVIDVVIPADVTDGFLFVSALDVSGNIFHLLPSLINEENEIAKLRGNKSGPVSIRVAYPLADAADGTKLAFTVDDTALGKTKIVAIRSDSQIFDGLRPTTESAGGYAQALRGRTGKVQSLDSRILVTAKP